MTQGLPLRRQHEMSNGSANCGPSSEQSAAGTGPGWRTYAASALVLAVVVGIAYYPSFKQFFLMDQWFYLADTTNCRSFSETVAQTWSWNRTRQVAPGDHGIFRPLFFVFLALEKSVFEYRAELWQSVGIALHWLCCYLLFLYGLKAVRWRVEGCSGRFAGAGTRWERVLYAAAPLSAAIFFASNPVISEQVYWCHISGYQITLVLVTLAAFLLRDFLLGDVCGADRASLRKLAAVWVLLALAAFNSELGIIAAALAGPVVLVCMKRSSWLRRLGCCGLLLLIPFVYEVVNQADIYARFGPISAEDFDPEWILRHQRAFSLRSVSTFFMFVQRGLIDAFFRAGPAIGWVVVLPACGLTALGLLRDNLKRRRGELLCIVLYPFLLCLAYMGLTVYARLNVRGDVRRYQLYPALFLFLLFSLPLFVRGLVCACAWLRGKRSGCAVALAAAVNCGLLALALCEVPATFRENASVASGSYPVGSYPVAQFCDAVREFIAAHGNEPDFSIAADESSPRMLQVPVFSMLFRKFENAYQPKYLLRWNGRELESLDRRQYLQAYPDREQQLLPEFVRCVAPIYNLWRCQGKYWAIAQWDPNAFSFALDAPSSYSAVGDTIGDVLHGLPPPEKVAEQALVRGLANVSVARANFHGYQIVYLIFFGEKRCLILPAAPIDKGVDLSLRSGGLVTASSLEECEELITTIGKGKFSDFVRAYLSRKNLKSRAHGGVLRKLEKTGENRESHPSPLDKGR